MDRFLQDLRYGFRMLIKSPGFTIVALVTLALGIGANTAIFSVVNAVLLRPLPYEKPERLVMIWGQITRWGIPRNSISQPEYADLRERNEVFDGIGAYASGSFNVSGSDKPEYASGAFVSHEMFDVLGRRPVLGRAFTVDEEKPGAGNLAILSDGFWRRHFAADAEIVGKTIMLDGEPSTIVGVMPPQLPFPAAGTDLYVPLTIDLANNDRGSHYLKVLARMKPGVDTERAGASLTKIARNLETEYPDNYKDSGWNLFLVPLHEQIVGTVRPALLVLLGAVAFVLVIACANVANLMLARAAAREKEVAIRTALGAGRWRLIRQLLTESLVLAILGGGLGLLLAFWGIDALVALGPADLPRVEQISVDGNVLLFSLAASLLAGALFGVVPALQVSRPSLNDTLKDTGGRTSAGVRGRRVRNVLVVLEVAVSLVLVAGAGLMIRSFSRLLEVDPGFQPRGVMTARMFLNPATYTRPEQIESFYSRLLERLGQIPGVESASAITQIPMGGSYSSGTMTVKDRLGDENEESIEVDQRSVGHAYFDTMGLSLVKGRSFSGQDRAGAPPVAIVDESFARRYWPDSDPIGREIKIGGDRSPRPWKTIVGVVRHVKQYGLDQDGREQAYFPFTQEPQLSMVLLLRTKQDPLALSSAVQAQVQALDKDLPIYFVRTMEQVVAGSVAQSRFSLLLLAAFAGVALVLAAVGIYGVMAWSVSQRHHEIGIRMALGAQGTDVLRLMLRAGLTLTVAGVLIGLASAMALTRLMESLLFQVSVVDPAAYVLGTLLLGSVAMLACYIPARRATRVDPMVALRYE